MRFPLPAKRRPGGRRGTKRPLGKTIALVALGLAAAYAASIGLSLLMLPSVALLKNSRRSFTITVKDWNRKDRPLVVGPRNRYWTPLAAVPSAMKKAVVAAEDARFYRHDGVDYDATLQAIKADFEKGRFARGGSTITQQVAKNLYLSREKTITRKVKEILLAHRMDDALSKGRILELYLNVAELGPMVYGIGHASRYYFGKTPGALTVRECAFLAAMLPGPKVYNPYRRMDRVMRRSNRILRRMHAARMITAGDYRTALAEVPNLEGLARKVERTIATPPPEPAPPPPDDGPQEIPGDPPADAGPPAPDPEAAASAAPDAGPPAPGSLPEVPEGPPAPPAEPAPE